MEKLYKRVINLVSAGFLSYAALRDYFLPIVPGAPLLLAGVFILFSDCARLHRWLEHSHTLPTIGALS